MSRKRRSENFDFATVVALPATSLSSSSATVSLKLVATTSPRRYGPWPDNARRNADENWLAYQRGKQYRLDKRQGQRTDLTSGNESQESCPKLQTAEKIAAVAGVTGNVVMVFPSRFARPRTAAPPEPPHRPSRRLGPEWPLAPPGHQATD